MVPFYTRYLLPAEYGTLELVEITAEIFGMFANAGMGTAVFKFYHKYTNESDRNRVVSSGILGAMALFSFFGMLGIFNADLLSRLIFGTPDFRLYFVLVFLRFFVTGAATIAVDYLRLTGQPKYYFAAAASQIV